MYMTRELNRGEKSFKLRHVKDRVDAEGRRQLEPESDRVNPVDNFVGADKSMGQRLRVCAEFDLE